jgi:hypothetical protein
MQFYFKNKSEKLVHLVGFIIRSEENLVRELCVCQHSEFGRHSSMSSLKYVNLQNGHNLFTT